MLFATIAEARAAESVDLTLVLVTDVSRSIDDSEFKLEKDGYVAAFTSPEVIHAIQAGANGAIGVAYVEFAGAGEARTVLSWRVIHDAASANAFAAALATHTGGGRIVLSNDGRPSGGMLKHAVLSGLLAAGCEVHDVGVAPTPTFGLAVFKLHAAGGVQITASHNPAQWNGMKLFGPTGAAP